MAIKNTASKPTAKKSLGQNFLQDANISRKIVKTLEITEHDSVLEIGPGPGALTTIIHGYSPAVFVAVEKDNVFAQERKHAVYTPCASQFEVLNADALQLPWHNFTQPWKFIGNLPYNVASPIMWEIVSRATGLQRAVFMIQKEVALRLVAKPETSAYGALSVWIQSFVTPKLEFIVPPHVFYPRPKVDSAVVSFVPLYKGSVNFNKNNLSSLLKICFQMRRKQLGSIFKAHGISLEILEKAGINPMLRPEALSPETFHRLTETMFF